jgi:hypothetical protein
VTYEELEKRVKYLEDIEKIKELHREYLFYISNLEFDKALDCFAENIVADVADYGIRRGKEEVAKFFKEVYISPVQGCPFDRSTVIRSQETRRKAMDVLPLIA